MDIIQGAPEKDVDTNYWLEQITTELRIMNIRNEAKDNMLKEMVKVFENLVQSLYPSFLAPSVNKKGD